MNKEQERVLLQHAKGSLTRHKGFGAKAEELNELYNRIGTTNDWFLEFSKIAQTYEKRGDAIQTSEDDKRRHYLTAAVYYHIGELLIFSDTEEKRKAFDSMAAVYAKASKYFTSQMEQVQIPFNNGSLSGYFRRPLNVKKAPCIILLRGVDACKEVELHIISEYLLKQQLFTLSVDLPGQGQGRFQGMKMTPDFEKPAGAIMVYLLQNHDIERNHIGILGMSFGGFIAPRIAAVEKRINACVSLGGYFGLDEFEFTLSAKLNCLNNMKISSESEWLQMRKLYSLKDYIDKLTCPLLVVNGSEDKIIPTAQSIKIYEMSPGPKDIKIYDGLGHCVFYEQPEALAYIAGWMATRLAEI